MIGTIAQRFTRTLLYLSITLFSSSSPAYSQSADNTRLSFVPKHRVNAHGDEFNSLAKTADGRFAIIGTEKGDVLLWNLTSQKVERTFHQPSAVHHVVALSDSRYLVAAGSNHYAPRNSLVRKWNLANGTFEDLPGLATESFPTALASDSKTGLLALGVADGTIIVWNSASNKVVATFKTHEIPIALAMIARDVYVLGITQESLQTEQSPSENVIVRFNVDNPNKGGSEFLKTRGRFWNAIDSSPDNQLLVAGFREKGAGEFTVIIEPHSRLELGKVEGSGLAWINTASFVQFEGLDPSSIVELNLKKRVSNVRKIGRMKDDTEGRAFNLTGQITNAQGTRAWATYSKGPGFLEFDLRTLKIKTLIGGTGGAYAISVATKDFNKGVVATGGADGYVRLWNLTDLALTKEYHVAPLGSTVIDVDLLNDGHRAVVGVMRRPKNIEDRYKEGVQILVVDLIKGTQRKLVDIRSWPPPSVSVIDDLVLYPGFDRMKLASIDSGEVVREFVLKRPVRKSLLSSNNKWLGVLDEDSVLKVFDVDTAREVSSRLLEADDYGPMLITSDGQYVHQVARGGSLITWNTQSGEMSKHDLTRIQQMHTNVDFITLANNDQWLVTAGNHGDIGIFERATGKLIFYERSSAAAFYVEKVWIGGDHLIFTTDTGIMIDGRLVTSAQE